MIRRAVSAAMLAALSAGCAFHPVQLGAPSSQRFDVTRSRDISAHACGFMLGGLIPIGLSNRDARALTALMQQANGDVVGDVDVEEELTYAVAGWVFCSTFHAVAYARE